MFEKIKSKLSKEYEEENNKVREMKRRRDLLESISFHERFTRVLGLSTVFLYDVIWCFSYKWSSCYVNTIFGSEFFGYECTN